MRRRDSLLAEGPQTDTPLVVAHEQEHRDEDSERGEGPRHPALFQKRADIQNLYLHATVYGPTSRFSSCMDEA